MGTNQTQEMAPGYNEDGTPRALDWKGRPIVRPRCPLCRQELKWWGEAPAGYECVTVGCENNGKGAIA